MRRTVTTLSAVAAGAMTVIMTASAAYAQVLAPAGGGATDPTTPLAVHHHAGLLGWQIALILVAATILVALTGTLAARRMRIGSHRPAVS
jgi:hypothetical protein